MKHLKLYESVENKDIVILSAGDYDWEGIYYNGKLINEGHNIDLSRVLKALGYNIRFIYIEEGEEEEKEEEKGIFNIFGRLPENLEDIETILATKKYNL